ncbi:MAG: hypothetical protein V1846_02540 [Candidatus Komeilibacteria bacterium]
MKIIARSLLLCLALIGLFSYITTNRAQKILANVDVPSDTQFQKLQYCLSTSDCKIVRWKDCNKCGYARAVNLRWANYFYDNADYYQYPIGFNTFYCQALENMATTTKLTLKNFSIGCEDQVQPEQVIGSGCDQLIKQCYAVCKDVLGRTHKCTFDSYMQRLIDAYLPQITQVKDEQ